MTISIKKPTFDEEQAEIRRIAEWKYGKIKQYKDFTYNPPNPVKPWMRTARNPAKILFSEFATPGLVLPVVVPVDSVPLRNVLFEVYHKNGVPHRQFIISTNRGTIKTNDSGQAIITQYEGHPFSFTTSKEGGYAGSGVKRELPSGLGIISGNFTIQPYYNHVLLITSPSLGWINGVEIPDPIHLEEKNPHIADLLNLE